MKLCNQLIMNRFSGSDVLDRVLIPAWRREKVKVTTKSLK